MRVLLVNPRTPDGCGKSYYLPLGLLYLATVCEKVGCGCQLLDFNTYIPHTKEAPDEFCSQILIEKLLQYKPNVIAFGCLFSGQFQQVIDLSVAVKEIFNDSITVIGGIHATSFSEEILLECQSIDFIVIGEGEITLEKLLLKLMSGDSDYKSIDGFAYRDQFGSVFVNKKTKYIDNIDDIAFPAYHLVNMDDYRIDTHTWHNPKGLEIKASIPIITSRGCPINCNFCPMSSVMGKKYRRRTVDNVYSELDLLYTKYGHTYFSFMDDNLTLDKKFIIELCNRIIDSGMNIQIDTTNGVSVNTLDGEVIDAMVRAGLVRVALAIESGSSAIRDRMGKSMSREKILEVVSIFRNYPSVFVRGFFILGMPEDTNETLNDTYELINEINIDSNEVCNLIPFPGTTLFAQAVRDNLFTDETCLNDLWKSTYVLSQRDYFILKPYKLEIDEMKHWREKFDRVANKFDNMVTNHN